MQPKRHDKNGGMKAMASSMLTENNGWRHEESARQTAAKMAAAAQRIGGRQQSASAKRSLAAWRWRKWRLAKIMAASRKKYQA